MDSEKNLGEGEQEINLLPREKVEKIEQFEKRSSSIIQELLIWEKINLVLVMSGVKKATEVTVFGQSVHDGEEFDDENILLNQEIDKVRDLLTELGLDFEVSEPGIQEALNEKEMLCDIYVARDKKSLEDIVKAVKNGFVEERGLALGYPQTAVEAYVGKRDKLDIIQNLPQEVKDSKSYLLLKFVPSKDSWQEEIKTAEIWAKALEANSPKLLADLVELHKEVQMAQKLDD